MVKLFIVQPYLRCATNEIERVGLQRSEGGDGGAYTHSCASGAACEERLTRCHQEYDAIQGPVVAC